MIISLYTKAFYRIQYYPTHGVGYGVFETHRKDLFEKEIARLENLCWDYDYIIEYSI